MKYLKNREAIETRRHSAAENFNESEVLSQLRRFFMILVVKFCISQFGGKKKNREKLVQEV